ncbi:hypothetical protein, partial [Nitratireductor sp. GCM10026969]|uniref:hypothetical protein n=1 Tax=Nitratireductor sp. GCM10026969 TaxID=3252645 RepID=UPI003619C5BB
RRQEELARERAAEEARRQEEELARERAAEEETRRREQLSSPDAEEERRPGNASGGGIERLPLPPPMQETPGDSARTDNEPNADPILNTEDLTVERLMELLGPR